MAGIGFELRKLMQRDDLLGIARGFGHAALATSGPWLFTVASLTAIVLLGTPFTVPREIDAFRLIVIYNFSFSLVLTGPLAVILTRYLADSIHAKDVSEVPAVMLGGLALAYAASVPIAAALYMWLAHLHRVTRVAAVLNFLLIAGIWIVSVFLTALKNYRALTLSFASGIGIGILCAAVFAAIWSTAGMLFGFNLGLALILFSLIARVLTEYPTRAHQPFAFLRYFRTHWDLALCALVYNLAVWADKWMMWLAPQHEFQIGLVSFPDYESAMFFSYLSVVPSIAAFTVTIETGFFEKYVRFYSDIQRHAPYGTIERNHKDLIQSLRGGASNFLVLQGSICVLAILLAPQICELLGINFAQLGMLRFGLLGAFFHSGFLFLTIVLSYFDLRRINLANALLFLSTNTLFTLISLRLGFAYYGYGYFLSALVSFAAAFLAVSHSIQKLPYLTFVRTNSSVLQ
ncbi:MAG: exopolysaccharide Pel transporter PelG [Acidobacteriia bacterium]|nr:exopolysaccharide Pel transporter PelG [Terriglobia bacterium]